MVIVAGIECDLTGASRVGDGSYHVDGLVTIEGCDLDGNNMFNFRELAPKFIRQNAAANGGLQVKAHYWNHGRYAPDVIKKRRNRFLPQVGKTQQRDLITKNLRDFRLRNCLAGSPANSGDLYDVMFEHLFHRQLKHRFE